MNKLKPIQYGFSAGEITPLLLGNTQGEVYKSSVAEALNMVSLAQGPVISRAGSLYVGEANNTTDIRLLAFNVGRGEDFVIELGPLYLRIFNLSGLVDIGGQELINDVFFFREFTFWADQSQNGIVTFDHDQSTAIFTNSGGGGGNRVAAIDQQMDDVPVSDLGSAHTLDGNFSGDGQLLIEVGTTQGASDVFSQTVTVAGDFSFAVTPTSSTNWITFTNTGGASSVANLGIPRFNRDSTTTVLATPYEAEDLPEIQTEMISSIDTLILTHSRHPVKSLTLVGSTDFQFQDAPIVNQPTNWTGSNYPNVVTVFQGRLWLARTPNKQQGLWSSKSGDYFDFDQGTAQADEGIFVELASQGEIEWLRGQKNLLIGTDLGEYRVDSQNGIITPSDIDIRQQSAYGSATLIQSRNIGDQVLYVSPDNKKLRALTFDAFQQGWYSPDLTWTAEHITQAGIKEIHFARDPSTLIICVLDDGKVAACTYDRSQNALGWSEFIFTDSTIESAAVINGDLGSDIFGALKQANGKMVIIINAAAVAARTDLDSTVQRPVEAGNVVTGLDHLDNLEVDIKVDGAVHPSKTVVSGQITLDYSGTSCLVGIGFPKRIKTVPLDVGGDGGTGSGELKHWAKIYVRTIDSYIPMINGKRPPTRSPSTPMNEPEDAKTQDIQVTDLGRTRLAQITIEQDLPLRLTILNLFGIEGQAGI